MTFHKHAFWWGFGINCLGALILIATGTGPSWSRAPVNSIADPAAVPLVG